MRLDPIKYCALLVSGALLIHAHPASAQTIAEQLRGLMSTTDYREVTIAPDHRHLAWVEAVQGAGKELTIGTSIRVASTKDRGAPVLVSAPAHAPDAKGPPDEDSPVWSPDGATLAFLSDAQSPGQKQLFLYDMMRGETRRLTSVQGYLATPLWSHDGRSLAVLITQGSTRIAGPLSAGAPSVGVIDEHAFEQRIATVDLASGSVKPISPEDLYVYEYDWSPDGRTFAATAAHGSGDNNWYIAELYVINAGSGLTRSLVKSPLQLAVPRWSPDGRTIAYIGGLSSDESIASGDPYLVSQDGGEPRRLAAERRSSAFWLAWRTPDELLLGEAADGGSALTSVNVKSFVANSLYQDQSTLRASATYARGVSLAADGKTTAVIRETFNEPPTILVGEVGRWRPAVNATAFHLEPTHYGAALNVHWNSDGLEVQGWLVPPKSVSPGVRYPMVVWIHGGPAWLNAPSWPTTFGESAALLAAHGYYVFLPNPRGSAGFGEVFKKANVKDLGGGDLRDILAGVDQVVKSYPVDNDRVGITGWSYGGYMTMWALTQTQRFRAGVVGAGLSDWLSYYGENGIDEWMIPYFGASVYDDPAVYAKSSPINFIKNVHTPTLLVVGDRDVECPTPQSFEYWHALKEFRVKTELVVYPDEGHQFKDPEHAIDVMVRMLDWFDSNMSQPGG